MATEARISPLAELLRSALLNPGDLQLLASLRSSAGSVLDELERLDDDPFLDAVEASNPEWVATVYEALVGEQELPHGELIDALFEARCTEDREIGLAFDQALCVSLPAALKRWEGFELVENSSGDRARLLQEPSARASEHGENLVRFGMTPKTVLIATEAMAGLADRFSRRLRLSDRDPVWMVNRFEDEADQRHIDMKLMSNEVALAAELPQPNAAALARWCFEAARYKPRLFNGFRASCNGGELELTRRPPVQNLYDRWASEFAARPSAGVEPYCGFHRDMGRDI